MRHKFGYAGRPEAEVDYLALENVQRTEQRSLVAEGTGAIAQQNVEVIPVEAEAAQDTPTLEAIAAQVY
jgi:hypothetical protein